MESVIGKNLDADEVHLNNSTISCLTPEVPLCPKLPKLFLQEKSSFSMLPPSFFEHMPVLKVLDLSHTSIQSLPASISKLCLLENFILRECSLLMEIPPEIGAVKNLKVFDLEGTEIMYLPKEIGKLETLECLRVSLSAYADEFQDKNGIEHIIPRMTISKLTKLKELSISVDPEAKWWEVEVLEAIMHDLLVLPDLKSLRLCLPTTKLVQQFLSLERYQVPIFSGLWNFGFMIGHCEQLPFSVQLDMEENFLKLEKCIKYMNGEGCMDENAELVRQARALYLRRHWTIEKLSVFDIRRLQYCLLMECNEMQTLVHQEDIFEDRNKAANHGEEAILGSLQFLAIHFMKKLQRICTGPIGRKGLSCLRVLALHTCPELTSIFTGCLLDNFENLTELIVEDCPKVKSLVTLEGTSWSKGPFLPNLKRVSLLDLPGLVSISSGVCIAPHLDTLLVFNCMSLDYLSIMELPRCTKVIKGETEWWDALKYGKLTWNSVFVQLKRDGGLMDQLAEDMNSLQHFLELPLVPTHPGSSLQVDQNSSRNDHPWCNYQDIDLTEDWELVEPLQIDHNVPSFDEFQDTTSQKILNSDDDTQSQYAGTAVRIWESPCPVSGKPHNEETECDFEVPSQKDAFPKKKSFGVHRRRKKVKVTKKMVSEEHLDDGYIWRKYGQKEILGSKYPRSYYRCSLKHLHGCGATKQVQRSTENPSVFKATYHGNHTCPRNLPTNCSSLATKSASTTSRIRDSSTPKEPASTINDSHFQLPTSPLAVDSTNKKSFDVYKRRKSVKATTKMVIEEHLDDGYIWRKYGQKETLGSKYPRQYYLCSLKFEHGCRVTKQVQRFTENPSVFEVTYFGNHTCPRKLHTKFSSLATETASTTSRIRDSSTPTESASTINDSHFQLATSPQAVDSTNKPKNSARQHDLFEESLKAAGLPRFDNGAKLHVSNLDVGVTTEDIRELFSEIGEVKRYAIHYDKNGRSSGSAEVLFAQRSDAFQALKRYNNVQLDGRPMKIEIEVSNPEIPPSAPTLRNNSSTRKPKWTTQVRVISKSGFEKPPDDGYRWKKYGQKQVKGGDSRGYYRCTSCNTKKRVERSSDDPSILEITYQGVHTCLGLSITSDSTTVTKSALSTLENSDTTSTAAVSALSILTTAGSASTVTEDSFGLDSIKNMSGNASIQNWNAVKNKIQSSFSPPFELKSSSSVTSEANPRAILEAVRNNSMNLLSTTKTPEIATESPLPASMRDKSSVVSESYEHIDFLHNQVRALITPQETKQGEEEQQLEYVQLPKQDLRSQGLCLVPVSRASPTVGEPLDEYR